MVLDLVFAGMGKTASQVLADVPAWSKIGQRAAAFASSRVAKPLRDRGYNSDQIFEDPYLLELATHIGAYMALMFAGTLANGIDASNLKVLYEDALKQVDGMPAGTADEVEAPAMPSALSGTMNYANHTHYTNLDCW